MRIAPGACFLLDHGHSDRHYFFVISDPIAFPDRTLVLVPITGCSSDKSEDHACLLNPGEHACCVKASFVFYRGAIFLTQAKLAQMLDANKAVPKPPDLNPSLLSRFRAGADRSDELSGKYREELWQQNVVQERS